MSPPLVLVRFLDHALDSDGANARPINIEPEVIEVVGWQVAEDELHIVVATLREQRGEDGELGFGGLWYIVKGAVIGHVPLEKATSLPVPGYPGVRLQGHP